jgi:hypothetical protein
MQTHIQGLSGVSSTLIRAGAIFRAPLAAYFFESLFHAHNPSTDDHEDLGSPIESPLVKTFVSSFLASC